MATGVVSAPCSWNPHPASSAKTASAAILDNDIYQAAGHNDDFADRLVFDKPLHILVGHREFLDRVLAGVSRNRYSPAQFAVYLHHKFNHIKLERRLVELGPALINQRRRVAELRP